MFRRLAGTLSLLTCATFGCEWTTDPSPPKEPSERESVYVDDSGLKAKKSGIDLAELLDLLPSDLRDNLSQNELRRKRANEWLAANVVGKTFESDCKAAMVTVQESAPGQFWIRVWLEEAETAILGESAVFSVGPGCTPAGLGFPLDTPEAFILNNTHAMVFHDGLPNPAHTVLGPVDQKTAEGLADLRGKPVKLRGAIRECAFYPVGFIPAGGFRIRLGDATLNDLPAVASLPVTDALTNPWQIAYEPLPIGSDAQRLSDEAKLDGSSKDSNATQWTSATTYAPEGSLEGQWFGRWKAGKSDKWHVATAPVDAVVRDDRLLLRYTDEFGTNLIVLKKSDGGAYVGRYLNAAAPAVCSPFAALVVSPERIDGAWIDDAGNLSRWDFRRQVTTVNPDPNSISDFVMEQERERQAREAASK